MALDPYRRKTKQRYRSTAAGTADRSRVPMIMGAIGFVAMLALVYSLSATLVRSSSTIPMFAAHVQTPP